MLKSAQIWKLWFYKSYNLYMYYTYIKRKYIDYNQTVYLWNEIVTPSKVQCRKLLLLFGWHNIPLENNCIYISAHVYCLFLKVKKKKAEPEK